MIDFVFKYLMLTGLLIELIMIIAAKQRNQWTFGIIYCLCLDFQLLLLKLVFVSYHMLKFAKKKRTKRSLLILHWSSLHPALHPPSHFPVTLSHIPCTPQLILQLSLQLNPYLPGWHSVEFDKITSKIEIIHSSF